MNIGVFFRLAATHISESAATTAITGVFCVCVHGFTFLRLFNYDTIFITTIKLCCDAPFRIPFFAEQMRCSLATGFFILQFQFVKKKAKLNIKFFKGSPIDTITTAWTIERSVN